MFGCACPHELEDPGFIEAIAIEHARGYTSEFLRRFRDVLDAQSSGMIELLDRWVASDITFDTAWDPCLSLIRSAALGYRSDPVRAAALLCLHLGMHDVAGDWIANLRVSSELYAGRFLFPSAARITAVQAASSLHLKLLGCDAVESGTEIIGGKCVVEPGPVVELPHCLMKKSEIRFGGGRVTVDFLRDPAAYPPTQLCLSEVTAACAGALRILREIAPMYLDWVDRVVRLVLPLHGSDMLLRSASVEQIPATIAVSFPARPVAIAEMLVHEASHQYFHIVRRAADVSDPTDQRLYYSPIKGSARPIDPILLAFHAFANVVLFYSECVAAGMDDDGYCTTNIERHLMELEILAAHLDGDNSVTEAGHSLWKPVAQKIFSMRKLGAA